MIEENNSDNKSNDDNVMKIRDCCWYCGGLLVWQSDFNYDEIYYEGEGIVSFLECSNCGAVVEYSLRTDNPDEDNEKITIN